MSSSTKSITFVKSSVEGDTGYRKDVYRVTYVSTLTGERGTNVALGFKRIGAGLFEKAPYAFEVWTDDADNLGNGTYRDGRIVFDGRECCDMDGVEFLPASLVRVLRGLQFTVSDDFLAVPLKFT